MLAGLAYAHTRKSAEGSSLAIIHRDVSPSNILCSAQGEVKLSDFGIAKAATHSSLFYRVRGKVGYMSPEQARNEPIDHRTDLYSVAVCLYEALTAERLFVGDLSTPADVLYSQPIVPPSQKRKLLPRALDVVMATALAPKPEDRYQDAVAFAEALRQVAHRHGLGFSAPQLAEHLRHILGRNPDQWLSDDKAGPSGDPSTQKIAKDLEGKEAKSIGVVMDGANLYVVDGGDVVSPKAPVSSRNPKSDPLRRLCLDRLDADEERRERRHHPPAWRIRSPERGPDGDVRRSMIPIDEDDDDDAPTKTCEFAEHHDAGPSRGAALAREEHPARAAARPAAVRQLHAAAAAAVGVAVRRVPAHARPRSDVRRRRRRGVLRDADARARARPVQSAPPPRIRSAASRRRRR